MASCTGGGRGRLPDRLHHRISLARRQESVRIQSMLACVQVVVPAAQRKQRLVCSVLHDLAALHHQDLVGAPDG